MLLPCACCQEREARETTEKGIFVGYAAESKSYRIYNLNEAKIHICRYVHFDELACWNWDLKEVEQKITTTLEATADRTGDGA